MLLWTTNPCWQKSANLRLWVSGVGFASKEFVHIASYRHQHYSMIEESTLQLVLKLDIYLGIQLNKTLVHTNSCQRELIRSSQQCLSETLETKFQEYACTVYARHVSFPIIQVSCQQSHSQTFKVCMLSDSHQASGAQKHRTCIL